MNGRMVIQGTNGMNLSILKDDNATQDCNCCCGT